MQGSNTRCQRSKENQTRHVVVGMYFRENANHPIVKYLEKAVRRFIRSGHVWYRTKEPVPHITSTTAEENNYIKKRKNNG